MEEKQAAPLTAAGDTNGSGDGVSETAIHEISIQDSPLDEGDALGTKASVFSPVAEMPVARNATHYNMNNKRRGMAIIFNHEHFSNPSLPSRTGTNADSQNLQETFQQMGFDVTVHKDYGWKQMELVIEKAASANHSEADCFLMVVLSHGEEGVLFSRDMPYKLDRLWSPFTADMCPTLAGKPKMFFIQACQGDRLDGGVRLVGRSQTDSNVSYKIPAYADFLIAYSTIPGFYSWRNTQRGSWFMQAFCEQLRRSAFTLDLMTLLTLVSQRVALDYESNSSIPHMHGQKQIPCYTTMLTRLIRFTQPKPKP